MVGYGGTHSIELLRKPSAEYDHDENTTLRVLWTCTKKISLMFYRVTVGKADFTGSVRRS